VECKASYRHTRIARLAGPQFVREKWSMKKMQQADRDERDRIAVLDDHAALGPAIRQQAAGTRPRVRPKPSDRDACWRVSGFVPKIGGPSVFPPQPVS